MLRCQCAVNVRNNQGFTPLHLAASVGAIVVCQSLLIGGAHMNCVNTQRKVCVVLNIECQRIDPLQGPQSKYFCVH